MDAESEFLTVASATGFEIGDSVIVEGTSYTDALIQAPNYFSGNELYGAHIGSTGENTIVRGVRVIGTPNPFQGNIQLNATGSVVEDCVADSIVAPTETNNQTNAEYEA
jgi:tryptophanase